MYKIVNNYVRVNFDKFFTPITKAHSTRGHQTRVFKHHATKRARIDVFSQRVINDWNSLPAIVVSAESVNDFKNKLDQHWNDRRFNTRLDFN